MTEQDTPDFSGVVETPEKLRFDEASLEAFMKKRVSGFKGPLDVKKFKGGQSNPTYLLSTPSRKYVLRRKPPGKLLPSAHAVDREYRVMTALGKMNFPAPATYALCEDIDIIGTEFFIMDFVEGRIFWDASLPDAAPSERRALYHKLVDVIADLHRIDYRKAGLEDFGKPGNYFERQIDRWSKQYKAAATAEIPAMNNLIDWLPTAIPEKDAVSIVHGDYRFDNVIFDAKRPDVLAVLDWELSTLGHPLADFTYFLMVWHFPPTIRGGLAGLDLEALGIPSLNEVSERYCEKTGRKSLADFDFCLAYNMFRLASIAQGVYARALQGNASSPEGMKLGESVPPLAAMAWEYAKKAGA
ncbi:MAG: phosphotransferase family protein [Parvularculaceae bacterium]|nr:phosphotransferase family protein [Parvularculaceae bacterium]